MTRYVFSLFICVAMISAARTEASTTSDCAKPVPEIFRLVSPSVVFISALSVDPFKASDRVSASIGSGFIIDADGLILTNSHVVYGRRAITVSLDSGEVIKAELVGADPILDLAVLRIQAPDRGLPVAKLGDSSKVEVGEEILAIGNPLGLGQTLTVGVVSGINRILPAAPMGVRLPMIQTDATINLGNSGGPLVNRCGEVIGVNTAILGEAQNIAFAVPINAANAVLPQLLKQGRVIRPWLGVVGKLIGRELAGIINLPVVDGLLVETVEPGSPAQKAGLHEGELPVIIAGMEFLLGGDIITSANGRPLNSWENFLDFVRSLEVGDKVRLTLYYEGETREVEFSLPERPMLPGSFY
jgi:S1-C subfamily serine protease